MRQILHRAPAGTGSAATSKNHTAKSTRLSPRLYRLACALLAAPCTVRDLIDAIPSNNPPAYVEQLRRHGLSIPCEHVRFTTADGEASWYGLYDLTPADREKLEQMVDGGG